LTADRISELILLGSTMSRAFFPLAHELVEIGLTARREPRKSDASLLAEAFSAIQG
jgi:hypothetical protein